MAKKSEEVAKKEDVDLATFAKDSIKISIDPERVGDAIGEIVKRGCKSAIERILKTDKSK